jgi:hypothetical protein
MSNALRRVRNSRGHPGLLSTALSGRSKACVGSVVAIHGPIT